MRRIGTLLVAFVVAVSVSAGSAPDRQKKRRRRAKPPEISASARAVLEKAVASMGGDAALAAIKGMRVTTKGTYAAGPMTSPYTAEAFYVFPNRMIWKLDAGMFKGAVCQDRATVWSKMMAPAARAAGPAKRAIREWLIQIRILLVRPLLKLRGATITGGAAEMSNGATVNRVTLSLQNGQKLVLTFSGGDKVLLQAVEGDASQMDGRPCTMKAVLSKHRQFGDVLLPSFTKTQSFQDGKLLESMEEETTAIEWNPQVPEDAFVMPTPDAELMKASLKQTQGGPALMLLHKGPYDTFGKTIGQIMQISSQVQSMPLGAVTAIFLNDPQSVKDPSELRTEMVLPVMFMAGPPKELPGGAVLKTLSSVQAACMTARGAYGESDVAALMKLSAWAEKNGYEVVGRPQILYHHNPALTVPEDQLSEVRLPIRKK